MARYVKKALEKLNHTSPKTPQHTPHKWAPITYGRQPHNIEEVDDSPILSKEDTINIQKSVGTFLYYTCVVDNTIHCTINDIATTQLILHNKKLQKKCSWIIYIKIQMQH